MADPSSLLLVAPSVAPPLDPTFRPVALGNRAYARTVAAAPIRVPLVVGLERNDGLRSLHRTAILPPGSGHDGATNAYVERLIKFLLWQVGGWKVTIGGPPEIGQTLAQTYSHRGLRAFDVKLMETPSFHLYLVRDDGTGVERLTTEGHFNSFPMFSPDGKRLVWVSDRNATAPGELNVFLADWVP